MPKDGKLTPAEQAELSVLLMNINNAGKRGRKALALAIKEAAEENPAFAPHLKPYMAQMQDVLDEKPPEKPEDKPLTRKELEAWNEEQEGKRRVETEKEQQAAARQKLLAAGRFDAESIKGLDSFMEKHGYTNVDHAAILYAHENPPTARSTAGQSDRIWELPRDKELLKDPKRAGLKRAYQVVDEMRRRA